MKKQIPYYLQLMRVDKPIGWLLLLWPTLWTLSIAGQDITEEGQSNALFVWVFVIEVFIMRSAGCVINDYADRNIDGKVERTKQRPLAAGNLTANQALGLFVLLGAIALVLMCAFLPMRVWPWALPGAAITIAYPFMKRFIQAPQLVLGLAFSFSIPMVYVAYGRAFDLSFWLLMLVNFFWVLVYDTQYAMSDREDDLKIGVNSTAIYFGEWDKRVIGVLQIVIICIWLALMSLLSISLTFLIALLIVVGMFIYQQWLISDRLREPCFRAFLNNGWVGGVLWFGLLVGL
ncbi:MAG: 4-hydroxybenzoate octaprenyltransferase [Acidiferrobacterales bacterium]|nr:4-hydroxybenzoate octaprenyltransferase [Acidiferrobacterales bacterium]